jgi:lipopolysaccharide/colanic/teichoic acid biosynthesis glycosyltransferase
MVSDAGGTSLSVAATQATNDQFAGYRATSGGTGAWVERRSAMQVPEALRTLSAVFFSSAGCRERLSRRLIDRTFDIIFASVLIIVSLPLMLIIAIWIRLDSPGPIFYRQLRVGRNARLFHCLKLRSMWIDADRRLTELLESQPQLRDEYMATYKLRDDPRITWLGGFLRKTSLDELPQLFNVLCGSMSLVGPRPVVPTETALYGDHLPKVLTVRPGMTGSWQVSGRNDMPYEQRCQLDVQYADSHCIRRDMKILLKTAKVVIAPSGNGAY